MDTFFAIFDNNLKVWAVFLLLGMVPVYRLPSLFANCQYFVIGIVFAASMQWGIMRKNKTPY